MRERKLQRMKGYDYSTPGAYFVTICVHGWGEVLGEVCSGTEGAEGTVMILSEFGKIVEHCWLDLPNHYPNCRLDVFAIMPNHVHGIVWVVDESDVNVGNGFVVGNGFKPFPTTASNTVPPKRHGLPEFMRGFKTFSSRRINELNPVNQFQWHKSYHDRIVRNEDELNRIRKYIIENPENWFKERETGIIESDEELFGTH